MRPTAVRNAHSAYTNQSVAMLGKTDEFRHFQAVKDQGQAFRTLWIWGVIVFFGLLYADFMSALIQHVPFPAAAMSVAPWWACPLLLVAVFYAAAWVHTSAWSSTYDRPERLFLVIASHAVSATLITALPMKELLLPPFVHRATVENPWPAAVPFLAVVPVGLALFYGRFTGFWKRKALVRSPTFGTAPVMLVCIIIAWLYVGRVYESYDAARRSTHIHASQNVTDAVAQLRTAVTQVNAAWVTSWTTLVDDMFARPLSTTVDLLKGSKSTTLKNLYFALAVHSFALAFTSIVLVHVVPAVLSGVASLLGLLLPSPRTRWVLMVLGVVGAAGHLQHRNELSAASGACLGSLLTILLIRGFPAQQ
jgi:hypothetical protein